MRIILVLLVVIAFNTNSVIAKLDQSVAFSEIPLNTGSKINIDNELFLKNSIGSIEIFEVMPDEKMIPLAASSLVGAAKVIFSLKKIMALGTKLVEIVKAGAPVFNNNVEPIDVLPFAEGVSSVLHSTANWSDPKSRTFAIVYKNLLGMEVVSMNYTFLFQYGGSYLGKGKYLQGITVVPSNVGVIFGYSLDVSTSLISISNKGTVEDPIAAATMVITYTVRSALKVIQSSITYHISGDGSLIRLL